MLDRTKIRKRVGHRIKVMRVDRNLKQEELAALINMRAPQLSEIERGIRSLRVDQLMEIAQALKCSASYLLGEEKNVA